MTTNDGPAPADRATISSVTISKPEAERLTKKIKLLASSTTDQLIKLKALVDEAEAGQAHVVLGYASWTAYVASVLAELRLQLNRNDRRQAPPTLAAGGAVRRAGRHLAAPCADRGAS